MLMMTTPQEQSSSSSSRGRNIVSNSSPEFEFWMLRNPSSFPQTNLLSADELFAGGVLLPLRPPPLRLPSESDPDPDPRPKSEPGPLLSSTPSPESSSKRWRDIFKITDKKSAAAGRGGHDDKEKEKKKKKERKSFGGGATSAELNINLWPFSRSRSAGNSAVGRPRSAVLGGAGSRKVSSAPCSRSNSAGDSNSRKWPCSPGRPGVHVGRSSPAWQVRRRRSEPAARSASKGGKKEGLEDRRKTHIPASSAAMASGGVAKARVLNLNVPMCIGYRHHSSCRGDENTFSSAAAAEGGRSSHFFSLRGLFTKKVH